MQTLTVIALVLQLLAPYIFWPSRWNVPAHLNLGFCVTAYIVPGLFTDVWDFVTPATNELYAYINVTGAIALVFGMGMGFYSPCYRWLGRKIGSLKAENIDVKAITKRAVTLAVAASIGICLAYAIMGFIPMFAADPLNAKQFKGDYFEPYQRAAYIFRFSFAVIVATLPVILTLWWYTKKRIYLWLSMAMIFLLMISLARGASLNGVLMFAGVVAARKRLTGIMFVFFLAIIYPVGSASYLILGILTGIEKFGSVYSLDSVASIVGSGTPDIIDQITFLEGFSQYSPFTYGKTMVGGLVPSNYIWNPSVWTLTYDNIGADISDVMSGGLRLTIGLWGYSNFSWLGVILIPAISGFITGVFLRTLRSFDFQSSVVSATLVLMFYTVIGKFFIDFYLLSIHSLPVIASILFICFGFGLKRRKAAVVVAAIK